MELIFLRLENIKISCQKSSLTAAHSSSFIPCLAIDFNQRQAKEAVRSVKQANLSTHKTKQHLPLMKSAGVDVAEVDVNALPPPTMPWPLLLAPIILPLLLEMMSSLHHNHLQQCIHLINQLSLVQLYNSEVLLQQLT